MWPRARTGHPYLYLPRDDESEQWYAVEKPQPDGRRRPDHDGMQVSAVVRRTADGLSPRTVTYRQTARYVWRLIHAYVRELKAKHGTLEDAVQQGRARGLKRWVGWRFRDELRRRVGQQPARRLPYRIPLPEPDVWHRANRVGLSRRDRAILRRYLDRESFAQIAGALRCGESTVRRRVKYMEQAGIVPPRARWRRRPIGFSVCRVG